MTVTVTQPATSRASILAQPLEPDPGTNTVTITKAYKYRIDPTPSQQGRLWSHMGGSRYAYNTLLALLYDNWNQIKAEKEAGGQHAEYLSTRHFALLALWNAIKGDVAPWWLENSSYAYNDGAKRASLAFTNFTKGRARPPKYHKRGEHDSYRTPGVKTPLKGRHHVHLPKVGSVKTFESMRKLARHVERGSGRVIATTVSHESGRWFVSFTTEVQIVPRNQKTASDGLSIVGVDVGIATFATVSRPDGTLVEKVQNPRHYVKQEKTLAKRQRQAARKQGPSKDHAPSKRWLRANKRVQNTHHTIVGRRTNFLHNTTTRLCKTHDVITIETLNVKGMLKNHKLAKHISDAAWAEFFRQLKYKAGWYGCTIVVADQWFASSKTCSGCGVVKAKLALSERLFECDSCGLVVDRDVNAAINLARVGETLLFGSNAGTSSGSGRGGDGKTVSGYNPETAQPDETTTLLNTPLGARESGDTSDKTGWESVGIFINTEQPSVTKGQR